MDGRTYQGLHSYWDCQNSAHGERLLKLMKEWILDQTLPQSKIEARLHHFHFENQRETLTETTEETNKPKSYRDALGANMIKEATTEESTEAQRLYQLCVQQVEPTLQLRERTDDENKSLLMVLNHELQVPFPPRFLIRSMDARELAYFTDIFMAIEYPLYAHLAPG
ncbi:hypothetical protein PI124_g17980 [Phytophthora idaei]|nr:hypothetical protein PI125_g21646 [Phytophthora idaei]KAG3131643.1 hypothetical protein PI126_g19968 [Phytophthora idaei]KAG3237016.1 hypothetical protein PI124_g17980 [Phytophthora idaei]